MVVVSRTLVCLASPYAVLGLRYGAARDEVKKAFLALAKQYHPDSSDNANQCTVRFVEIQKAYDTLKKTAPKSAPSWTSPMTSRQSTAAARRSSSAHRVNARGSSDLLDEIEKWHTDHRSTAWHAQPEDSTIPEARTSRKASASSPKKQKKRRTASADVTRNASDSTADLQTECGLCKSVLAVPTRLAPNLPRACSCSPAYCLSCVRDALGLTGVTRQRTLPSISSCSMCGSISPMPPPSETSYVLDLAHGEALDLKCGPAICPRCRLWCGPRAELASHVKKCHTCKHCGKHIGLNKFPYHDCGKLRR
ncbi:hypothetical protein DIPPA_70211 [Diplonema papillatum]|nr:hypothetical protein DIPPA_70211 [Diplonema papillatum]